VPAIEIAFEGIAIKQMATSANKYLNELCISIATIIECKFTAKIIEKKVFF
jgi:hypothetical protein